MDTITYTPLERHIMDTARQVFIEQGFAEASMSDIALRAGIQRTALHYYFRTKERLFEAVFSELVCSFLPTIHQVLMQARPLPERIGEVVDIYLNLLQHTPMLPVFIVREVQRDASHLCHSIMQLEAGAYVLRVKAALQTEMERGSIRKMPVEFLLYALYGLLFTPFLSRPLTDLAFGTSQDSFPLLLSQWRTEVIRQLTVLLTPQAPDA